MAAPTLEKVNAMRTSMLLLALVLLVPGLCGAGEQWQQIDDDAGIRVFKKDMPGSGIVAFKGNGIVDASMEQIYWVICDAEHEREWVEMLVDNVIVEETSPFDRVQYQNFDLPWPLADRDFVYRAISITDSEGRVRVELNSVEHPEAPKTKGVRAQIMKSSILLTPRSDGRTDVEVSIFSDPKGILPDWLINMVQESWPMETLLGMRKQVKKPFVKQAKLPPIVTARVQP